MHIGSGAVPGKVLLYSCVHASRDPGRTNPLPLTHNPHFNRAGGRNTVVHTSRWSRRNLDARLAAAEAGGNTVQYLFLFPLVCTVQYVRYRDYIKRDGQLMLGKTKAAAEAEARLRDRLGNVEAVRRASG